MNEVKFPKGGSGFLKTAFVLFRNNGGGSRRLRSSVRLARELAWQAVAGGRGLD